MIDRWIYARISRACNEIELGVHETDIAAHQAQFEPKPEQGELAEMLTHTEAIRAIADEAKANGKAAGTWL
jgi:hypothetical protein